MIAMVQVGCGSAGMRRLDVLRRDPRVRVVGLVDESRARLAAAMAQFDVTDADTDYQRLLSRVAAGAAVVSTPHAVHRDATCFALRRGLHVLCEKPAGTSAADVADCIAAARATGVHLAVGANHLLFPSVLAALRLVAGGSLGVLRSIALEVGHGGLEALPAWRLDGRSAGGGVLRDCGAHALLLVHSLLACDGDDVICVRARLCGERAHAVETTAHCELTTRAGRPIRIDATWSGAAPYRFDACIAGTRDTLRIDGAGSLLSGAHAAPVALPPSDAGTSWRDDTRAFIDLVASCGTRAPASAERALWCARITDALYRSAREQRDVSLTPSDAAPASIAFSKAR